MDNLNLQQITDIIGMICNIGKKLLEITNGVVVMQLSMYSIILLFLMFFHRMLVRNDLELNNTNILENDLVIFKLFVACNLDL